MMRFNSIGSFIGSRYTNRALPISGMRLSFVDSIGVLDGGPPGTRTPNLRIKRCPHPLGAITEPYIYGPPYVPCVPTAPRIGSKIGSTGTSSTCPSTFLLIVSNTLNGFSYRRTRNTKKYHLSELSGSHVSAFPHTKNANKCHCKEINGATGVQRLHGVGVLCYSECAGRTAITSVRCIVVDTAVFESVGGRMGRQEHTKGVVLAMRLTTETKTEYRPHQYAFGYGLRLSARQYRQLGHVDLFQDPGILPVSWSTNRRFCFFSARKG